MTGVETGRARIYTVNSSTEIVCNIIEDFDSTAAIPSGEWYLTADSLTGAEHLNGMTCKVVVDGGQHPDVLVEDGIIQLQTHGSVVHAGLGYVGYLESNELEGGGVNGPAQTKKKVLTGVGIRFFDTLYAKYGTDYYKLKPIEMRTASMRMDRPPEMFTGDVEDKYANESNDRRDGGWSREKRIIIVQDQPFPCNVSLVIPYITVSN